jgi:hypothetical protein
VDDRICNLDNVENNIQLGVEGVGLGIAASNAAEGLKEFSQQRTRNSGLDNSSRVTHR